MKVTVKQGEPPVEPEILADAIVGISKSMRALTKSGLNQRAIILLVSASSRVSQRNVERVLGSLENLATSYCVPAKRFVQ